MYSDPVTADPVNGRLPLTDLASGDNRTRFKSAMNIWRRNGWTYNKPNATQGASEIEVRSSAFQAENRDSIVLIRSNF
jgi:hypothetical protein